MFCFDIIIIFKSTACFKHSEIYPDTNLSSIAGPFQLQGTFCHDTLQFLFQHLQV